MGTIEPRPPVAVPDPRLHEPAAERGPSCDRPVMSHRDGGTDRLSPETVLERILVALGPGRIARELGLNRAVDRTRRGHEFTFWSGAHLGVEVQVQASLRSAAGSDQ